MPTVEELRRQYDLAVKQSADADMATRQAKVALMDAMRRDAMAELAALGIVPGSRVTHVANPKAKIGIFWGVEPSVFSAPCVRIVVRKINRDGTAHRSHDVPWCWGLRPQDIVLAEDADNA